jgi:hypothetical protein
MNVGELPPDVLLELAKQLNVGDLFSFLPVYFNSESCTLRARVLIQMSTGPLWYSNFQVLNGSVADHVS